MEARKKREGKNKKKTDVFLNITKKTRTKAWKERVEMMEATGRTKQRKRGR